MHRKRQTIPTSTMLGGKYCINETIGAGGMGAVYSATYEAINRQVAVKVLHPEFTEDPSVVERFHREARAAGSIGHDNICDVMDIGLTDEGAPFLVMPLLEGESLAPLIQGGEISLHRLTDIVCQTLSALQAAHDVMIIHRDLKPDNIFVTRFGDREDFVKLLDFGISKVIDQDSISELTQTGTIVGTPHYMAPEQARGKKDIDHRVDIYAIGVILYEALTGRKPFEGDSYNEVMFKILAEPYPAPSELNPNVTKSVEQVILRAMARDAAKRYASAREMRLDLEEAVTAFPQSMTRLPVAETPTTMEKDGPFTPSGQHAVSTPGPIVTERRSGRVGVAVSVIFIVVAIVLAVIWFVWPAEAPPPVVPLTAPDSVPSPASTTTPEPTPSLPEKTDSSQKILRKKEEPTPPKKEASKKSDSKKSLPKAKKNKIDEEKEKEVKGRSGTTFITDYD
ncbi:MAG: serine/threonine protein kinase [Deltaproteobacteria bacterium]|nr:serine/threonine protein kinase [Deltaproteobacteria bacterium]